MAVGGYVDAAICIVVNRGIFAYPVVIGVSVVGKVAFCGRRTESSILSRRAISFLSCTRNFQCRQAFPCPEQLSIFPHELAFVNGLFRLLLPQESFHCRIFSSIWYLLVIFGFHLYLYSGKRRNSLDRTFLIKFVCDFLANS